MRIAQVSPLYESVPPKFYGGTERIISYLTEELVRQGHEVTLFASGDSKTSARLISPCPRALRLNKGYQEAMPAHMLLLETLFSSAHEFDIIHSHIDFLTFPFGRRQKTPVLTTLHGRLDLPELVSLYEEFNDAPVVSISDAQRDPLPDVSWLGTVYHGLPLDLLPFSPQSGPYLAFLGRISVEKGVDQAIEIARAAESPLRIAAKVDPNDQEYYRKTVQPLLAQPGITFIGEIGERQKGDFLGNALGLLFPICWPEPFGLVLIEAMACGTPVIAYPYGSVPEIIEDGVTGFIVENKKEAVRAVRSLPRLSRRRIRKRFEERFSDRRMALDYVRLYTKLTHVSTENEEALSA